MARFRNNDQHLVVEPIYARDGLQIERVQRFDSMTLLPEAAQWRTWSFRITLGGTRYITHDGSTFTLSPNTICWCSPLKSPVSVRSLPGTGSDAVVLTWTAQSWMRFINDHAGFQVGNAALLNEQSLLTSHSAPPQVLYVLRRFITLSNASHPSVLAIENHCALLLRLIADLRFSVARRKDDAVQRQRVEAAQSLMVRDLAQPLRIGTIADALHVSARQLQRDFLAQTGITPVRYFNVMRLSEANFLLAETALSVAVIAEMLGYVSLTHFSTAFRQTYSYSPREVRKTPDYTIS